MECFKKLDVSVHSDQTALKQSDLCEHCLLKQAVWLYMIIISFRTDVKKLGIKEDKMYFVFSYLMSNKNHN